MSLKKISIVDGNLVSTGFNAEAISEFIDVPDELESVRNITSIKYLANVCENALGEIDTAPIGTTVSDGEDIVIIKDNVPYKTKAVVKGFKSDRSVLPIELKNDWETDSVIITKECSTYDDYKEIFAKDFLTERSGFIRIYYNNDIYKYYLQFEFATPPKINRICMKPRVSAENSSIYKSFCYILAGSNDGINFADIYSNEFVDENMIINDTFFNDISYKYYRLYLTRKYSHSSKYLNIYSGTSIDMFEDGEEEQGVILDTSFISNGTSPQLVYTLSDEISINAQPLETVDEKFEYGLTGTSLKYIQKYNDIPVTGNKIYTDIKFKVPNNKLLELTGQIFTENNTEETE